MKILAAFLFVAAATAFALAACFRVLCEADEW